MDEQAYQEIHNLIARYAELVDDGDFDGDAATARSCVTVVQALPNASPQLIATGRYQDTFERHNQTWRFTERIVSIRLSGNLTNHLRRL
ncbi:SnoaL-like domain-containing protein [Kribbella sandramycini]|uniref:3-phenylpropionate/cinnamic acid dioxygenase small subunit n=1 Tax=Kribbella sandramycini TaxID=60450 RepID=A0A7Y4KZ45_9ACTN|nr:3-phenylpropionate/cinnamic acid dioxygenase small subunit [Kribbella sandramycini]NOL41339.1 SnoaL-like domain-containing protein [Kribbella sandramycini]